MPCLSALAVMFAVLDLADWRFTRTVLICAGEAKFVALEPQTEQSQVFDLNEEAVTPFRIDCRTKAGKWVQVGVTAQASLSLTWYRAGD